MKGLAKLAGQACTLALAIMMTTAAVVGYDGPTGLGTPNGITAFGF